MTTDLKSMAVEECVSFLQQLASEEKMFADNTPTGVIADVEKTMRYKRAFKYETWANSIKELARRLEEAQQKIVAQEAKDNYVGRWLSAALDDPSVCEEMKADIGLWMASDYAALTTHDAELTAKAKAEALEEARKDYNGVAGAFQAWEIVKHLTDKAAEYRAKAGRKT